jgi:hypothetical protein
MSRCAEFLVIVMTAAALMGAAPAHAYETAKVLNGGTISGTVTFEGTPPEPETLIIGKDNAVCGEGQALRNQVKVGKKGELSQVVVFLERIDKGKAWPASKSYKIDQVRCNFDPFLQVVPRGASVKIVNSDPLLHNIHPFEIIGRGRRTLFNLAQPRQGQIDIKTIDATRGNVVELSCDAHNWMSGWLYVMDHPYFSVVDEDGRFSIEEIPAGTYKLVAWHPVLGSRAQEIKIAANGKAAASFIFKNSK